jgi:hypothetical protein
MAGQHCFMRDGIKMHALALWARSRLLPSQLVKLRHRQMDTHGCNATKQDNDLNFNYDVSMPFFVKIHVVGVLKKGEFSP